MRALNKKQLKELEAYPAKAVDALKTLIDAQNEIEQAEKVIAKARKTVNTQARKAVEAGMARAVVSELGGVSMTRMNRLARGVKRTAKPVEKKPVAKKPASKKPAPKKPTGKSAKK